MHACIQQAQAEYAAVDNMFTIYVHIIRDGIITGGLLPCSHDRAFYTIYV